MNKQGIFLRLLIEVVPSKKTWNQPALEAQVDTEVGYQERFHSSANLKLPTQKGSLKQLKDLVRFFNNAKRGLRVVVHICNPRYLEITGRRIAVPGKMIKTLFEKTTKTWKVWGMAQMVAWLPG